MTMKMFRFLFAVLCVAIFTIGYVNAQEEEPQLEKPIRIGVKLGVPNLVGFNAEYVLPFAKGRIAPNFDFSYIPLSSDEVDIKLSYWGLGANYYFLKPGKGLYGGLSYGQLGVGAEMTTVENGLTFTGEASLPISYTTLKVGGKHGKGFFFRWELGYAIAEAAETMEIKMTADTEVMYETVDVPPVTSFPLVFNIGFGVGF